ncbi:MAG TPA: TMEM175 family protein [Methanomicrobiales archaeon]|nr:TMEM175 family protein [Methanomicrobiales archaeon]
MVETDGFLFESWAPGKETLKAFSDGIFTVAVTLLVLEIRLPDISSGEIDARFLESLAAIAPKMLGFILSFFIIAMYWLLYHRLFRYIRETDRSLVGLNILFLFFIVLMPFPTYLLGLYGDHRSIVMFYAGIVAVTSAILAFMWRYASVEHRLVGPDLDDRVIRLMWMRTLIPVGVFSLSILVAIASPFVAMVMWVLNFFIILGVTRFYRPDNSKQPETR